MLLTIAPRYPTSPAILVSVGGGYIWSGLWSRFVRRCHVAAERVLVDQPDRTHFDGIKLALCDEVVDMGPGESGERARLGHRKDWPIRVDDVPHSSLVQRCSAIKLQLPSF